MVGLAVKALQAEGLSLAGRQAGELGLLEKSNGDGLQGPAMACAAVGNHLIILFVLDILSLNGSKRHDFSAM